MGVFRNTFYQVMTTLFMGLTALNASADTPSLIRFPDASATQIVFVARDELWQVGRAGGPATLLTHDGGRKLAPRYSPDGQWIAYTARHQKTQAVYVMPAAGGTPQRLTWWPNRGDQSDELVVTWAPDSRHIVFGSARQDWTGFGYRLYEVAVSGGPATPLPLDYAGLASFNSTGQQIAYANTLREFQAQKRYQGGNASAIYTYDLNTHKSTRIAQHAGTDTAPMWFGQQIYFLSDRDPTQHLNVWVFDQRSGQIRQVTHFTDYDIDYPALGDHAITFQQGGKLFTLDLPGEQLREVPVSWPDDYGLPVPHDVKVTLRQADNFDEPDFALAPDGSAATFAARGDLFQTSTSASRNLTQSSNADEDHPAWSPDGKTLAYTSDISGERQLLLRADGSTRAVTHFATGNLYLPVWAPDNTTLALPDGARQLWLVHGDGSAPRKVFAAKHGFIDDASFSPDSRWLAYSTLQDNQLRALHLYDIRNNQDHLISSPMNSDWSPKFSADGRYLLFVSARHEYTLRSTSETNIATVKPEGIYLLTLNPATPSPLLPASTQAATAPAPLELNGLMQRVVALPIEGGNFGQITVAGNRVIFLRHAEEWTGGTLPDEASSLRMFDITTQKETILGTDIEQFAVTPDGLSMLTLKQGVWQTGKTTGPASTLATAGLHTMVDPKAEWQEMLDNAWRLDRDMFVNPHLDGPSWQAVHVRYARLLPLVATHADLFYLLTQIHGELAASHTFIYGGDLNDDGAAPATPLLGADFALDVHSGRYQFARIYSGDNSRDELRSPLTEPGVDIKAGDYLLAVNGQALAADIDPYKTFTGISGPLTLTVARSADGPTRQITVRPLQNERAVRQQSAIDQNRQRVDQLSDGQIGYVYLNDLYHLGVQQFVRQYYPQSGKRGFVFDVRWNHGGDLSQPLLERLRRSLAGAYLNRQGGIEPLPDRPAGVAQIALINRFTVSDGDQFAWFFQHYGLGKVLGERSDGAVWGINAPFDLMDGTHIAIPKDALYAPDGKFIIENHGVDPDVAVDAVPDATLPGADIQLEQAVHLLLPQLGHTSPTQPAPPVFAAPQQ